MTEGAIKGTQACVEDNLQAARASVYSYLRRWGAHLDADEVTSVAGEALMVCAEAWKPERYKDFSHYVHLRMRDFVLKRLREVAPMSVGGLASTRLSAEEPPDAAITRRDEARHILETIPEPARTILWMRAEGCTFRSIGEAVHLSIARCWQICHKYQESR